MRGGGLKGGEGEAVVTVQRLSGLGFHNEEMREGVGF